MSTRTPNITTVEQLLAAPDDLGPCELVRGELIMMTPAGFEHGKIEAKLMNLLMNWNRKYQAGEIMPGDTGFVLERHPDMVRCPDVSFVCADRIPDKMPQDFFPGPPDLAIEIRSPNVAPKDVEKKTNDYLFRGVKVVWDVDPAKRTVTVHRAGAEPRLYKEADILSEPEILPGFELLVREIFSR